MTNTDKFAKVYAKLEKFYEMSEEGVSVTRSDRSKSMYSLKVMCKRLTILDQILKEANELEEGFCLGGYNKEWLVNTIKEDIDAVEMNIALFKGCINAWYKKEGRKQ